MHDNHTTPSQWTDDMSVGVDTIDQDHKILMSMLNRAQANLERGDDPAVFGRLLADLYDYTHYHFRKEEALMQACAYPDQKNHIQAHHELIEKLDGFLQPPSPLDKTDKAQNLVDFLQIWLDYHLKTMDKSYSYYVKGNEQAILAAIQAVEESAN